jgi:hypothetical protein
VQSVRPAAINTIGLLGGLKNGTIKYSANIMKKLLLILLSVELLVALVLGQCGTLHRHDFDQAFFSRHENPTPESQAELDRQKHINVLYDLGFSAVAFGSMAVVTWLALYEYSRRHRGSQAGEVSLDKAT